MLVSGRTLDSSYSLMECILRGSFNIILRIQCCSRLMGLILVLTQAAHMPAQYVKWGRKKMLYSIMDHLKLTSPLSFHMMAVALLRFEQVFAMCDFQLSLL